VDATADTEFAYVLSSDGFTTQAQGRCVAAKLPKADGVIAVVSEADISWHRITLPKSPPAKLRAALAGVLEEAVLDDTDATHFALAPDAVVGQPTWVAAVNHTWLRGQLAALQRRQVFVDRVVPAAWPDALSSGHFTEAIGPTGQSARQDVALTWTHADGVAVLRLQGGLARTLLPQPLPPGARWTATPEVATVAERWLGQPVTVTTTLERALQATRTLWNLRQFDLTPRNRGTRAARDLWRRWMRPSWRPVRYGLLALCAAQVLGLNLWAWRENAKLTRQKQIVNGLLQQAFPQVTGVLDAPLQMQREVDALRMLAGTPADNDFEPMLQAAASAWPANQPQVDNLRFDAGTLTLASAGWGEAEIAQFRDQLRPAGWAVDAADGRVTLSRAPAESGRP
jgi:general secretion pathway protein L